MERNDGDQEYVEMRTRGGRDRVATLDEELESRRASPQRPDYVKCVAMDVPEARRHMGPTWCGRTLQHQEFMFVDAAHAVNNAKAQGRLLTCRVCAKAIADMLLGHVA